MADTPADQPKRRRTSKPAEAKPAAATSRSRTKKAESSPSVPTEKKPAASKRTPKPETTKAETSTAKPTKPRAPRKPKPAPAAAAPAPAPAPSPTPFPSASPSGEAPRLGWLAALGAAAAVGGAWFVWRASRAEEPDYQLVEQDGTIEVRKYPSLVTASTFARGERQTAINQGFQTLADYLFARSRPGPKLEMTAPVLADPESGGWRVRFVMPGGKARGQLPSAPDGVELVTEPAGRFAAVRFSGRATDQLLDAKEQELRSWLQLKGLPHEGPAVHAFYNAPSLPGALRRNEVLIMLSSDSGAG